MTSAELPTHRPDLPRPEIRSRYRRNHVHPPTIHLRKRDLEILNTFRDYRFLTAAQVKALFFKSIHKARKRLFRLWQNKYLERVFLPPAMGEGSPFAIYALGSRGIRLLVSQTGLDREAVGQTIPKSRASYLFIEHTLKRNDFRIALTLSCQERKILKLLFWRQDKTIKTAMSLPDKKTGQLHKVGPFPDGFFGVRNNDKEYYYFLEIDRGTVDNKRMLLRFKAYHQLWLQRVCIKRYGIHNFRVLTVTTSEPRMANLMRTAKKAVEGNPGSSLFLFTTFDRYSLEKPESILEPIWKNTDSRHIGCMSLLGRPTPESKLPPAPGKPPVCRP
jgi:hypothetical protein